MADRAASVLARLRNQAAASGKTYQLCLQLFLPGRIFTQIVSFRPQEQVCSERWPSDLLPDRFQQPSNPGYRFFGSEHSQFP